MKNLQRIRAEEETVNRVSDWSAGQTEAGNSKDIKDDENGKEEEEEEEERHKRKALKWRVNLIRANWTDRVAAASPASQASSTQLRSHLALIYLRLNGPVSKATPQCFLFYCFI